MRDILTVLFKRKALILLFMVVVVVGVYVCNLIGHRPSRPRNSAGREYEATTPLTDSGTTPLISMSEND